MKKEIVECPNCGRLSTMMHSRDLVVDARCVHCGVPVVNTRLEGDGKR